MSAYYRVSLGRKSAYPLRTCIADTKRYMTGKDTQAGPHVRKEGVAFQFMVPVRLLSRNS